MKTLLNLLPEEKKESIERRLLSRFLLWQLFLVFVLQVFYLTVLVCTYLVLDYQSRGLEVLEKNTAMTSVSEVDRLENYEKKFDDINRRIEVIGAIDRSHVYFSKVFTLMDPLLPDGITVTNLTTKEYTVSLFGRAKTREQLLQLDENLKNGGQCFEKVVIPLENLFSQENIDFQVDFTLKPECLKHDAL
jgi:Tfp pilus assembly protein PilN